MCVIKEIRDQIDLLQKLQKEVKPNFAKVVSDKSIPLDERWELFCSAPSDLRDHDGWVAHIHTLETDENGKSTNFCWYDDFWIERHQTVDLVDLVSALEDDIQYYVENSNAVPRKEFLKQFIRDPKRIDVLKEEILESNLGSFDFDW